MIFIEWNVFQLLKIIDSKKYFMVLYPVHYINDNYRPSKFVMVQTRSTLFVTEFPVPSLMTSKKLETFQETPGSQFGKTNYLFFLPYFISNDKVVNKLMNT